MRTSIRLTLDGLVRALHSRGHALADAHEREMMSRPAAAPRNPSPRHMEQGDRLDDRRRR